MYSYFKEYNLNFFKSYLYQITEMLKSHLGLIHRPLC